MPRTLRKRHPTRERGRLARMHCRSVPLRTPAMVHPGQPRRQERRVGGQSRALARLPLKPWVEDKWPSCAENTAEEYHPTRERGRLARIHLP